MPKKTNVNPNENDKTFEGKYYLQHYESEYKPFFYGKDEWNGMNSCCSPLSPADDGIPEEIFDIESTYVIEYSVKIHKMTKEEYDEWINRKRRSLPYQGKTN